MSFKNIIPLAFITLAVLNLQCSDDETYATPEDSKSVVGEWHIAQVTYDGTIQTEWEGFTLSFTRLAGDSGTYKLSYSPADSIWRSAGTWKNADSKTFFREDQVEVRHHHEDNNKKMIMDFYLPWTQKSTCENSICIQIVTGHWTFTLER